MRTALLLALLAAAAGAAELSDKVAYVHSKEVGDDGRTITAVVKVRAKGTFLAVAGYAIDKDAKFQFYRGSKSGLKSAQVKEVRGLPGDSIEIRFDVRTPPPVVKARVRVALYSSEDEIPYSD